MARLRDELLNETLFSTLDEARELLAPWRDDYNRVRPHSAQNPADGSMTTRVLTIMLAEEY